VRLIGAGVGAPAPIVFSTTLVAMAGFDDDEDWVGTPPEGRYTRDRAKPEFWWRQRPVSLTAAGIGIVILVLIAIALLR
jgi:hypothetical protein